MNTEHGESSITIDHNLIIIKIIGAFNLEGINKAIEQLKSAILAFGQNEFKLLLDYTEAEGGTPEVFEKINECNVWLNRQNMTAKALVIASKPLLAILESRAPARSLQNTKNFYNKTDALNWLKAQ
jgi:hypothetical protein